MQQKPVSFWTAPRIVGAMLVLFLTLLWAMVRFELFASFKTYDFILILAVIILILFIFLPFLSAHFKNKSKAYLLDKLDEAEKVAVLKNIIPLLKGLPEKVSNFFSKIMLVNVALSLLALLISTLSVAMMVQQNGLIKKQTEPFNAEYLD